MSNLNEKLIQLRELISIIESEISPFIDQKEKLKNLKDHQIFIEKQYRSLKDYKPEIQAKVLVLKESLKNEITQLEDAIRCAQELASLGKYLNEKYLASTKSRKTNIKSKEIAQFNGHVIVNESASKVYKTLIEKIKKMDLPELGYYINLICDLSDDYKVTVVHNKLISKHDPVFHEKFFQNMKGSFLKEVLTYNHTLKTHFTLSEMLMYYVNFTINVGILPKK